MDIWTAHGKPGERFLTLGQVLNKWGNGPYPVSYFLNVIEYELELFGGEQK